MEGLRVLFVDDEDDFRETIVKRLNARKIQAMGAESGVRALEIVKDNDFDVIVLDVKMPGMDGIDALRRLRELDNPARVLIVTSFTEQRTVVPALRAGPAGYVYKDVDPDALPGAIRSVHAGHILPGADLDVG